MWCLQTGCDQAVTGQRWEAGCGSLLHGREPQAGEYRQGGDRTCAEEWQRPRDPRYSRTTSYWWRHDGWAWRDQRRSRSTSDHTRHWCNDRTGCRKCGKRVQWKGRHRWCDRYEIRRWHKRWCGAVRKGSYRKADPVCRYGREAFRSGTVLSGSYGIENPGNGRCPVAYWKGWSRDRWRKSQRDDPEA